MFCFYFVCLSLQWQLWGPAGSVLCLLVQAVAQLLSSGHPGHSVVPQQIRTLTVNPVLASVFPPPQNIPLYIYFALFFSFSHKPFSSQRHLYSAFGIRNLSYMWIWSDAATNWVEMSFILQKKHCFTSH